MPRKNCAKKATPKKRCTKRKRTPLKKIRRKTKMFKQKILLKSPAQIENYTKRIQVLIYGKIRKVSKVAWGSDTLPVHRSEWQCNWIQTWQRQEVCSEMEKQDRLRGRWKKRCPSDSTYARSPCETEEIRSTHFILLFFGKVSMRIRNPLSAKLDQSLEFQSPPPHGVSWKLAWSLTKDQNRVFSARFTRKCGMNVVKNTATSHQSGMSNSLSRMKRSGTLKAMTIPKTIRWDLVPQKTCLQNQRKSFQRVAWAG